MSLIDELKRRNVFKVGAAYLALGWIVTQVTATVTPALNLPASLTSIVVWIGVIGFPFAIVFSWVYELTPEGLKRESEVDRSTSITHVTSKRLDGIIIGMLAVGIGLAALQFFLPRTTTSVAQSGAPPAVGAGPAREQSADADRAQGALLQDATAPAAQAATAKPADDKSIAVLPFANRSDEHKDAFFVDGIHDDILGQLSRISALKVISRTSVEQFRATTLTMKEIAAKLGVTKILEGGVQRAGDRVRINVQLIDADTDAHLWAETYDRELTTANIFAIQSEVAGAIAGALEAKLTAGEKAQVAAVPTASLAAWEAYQLGKQRMAKRTSAALEESQQFFEKAVALDPKFALAQVGLADVSLLQAVYSDKPRPAALADAQAAADKALALDPNLAEAWTSSANIAEGRQEFASADEKYRRAIELGPNYATAHHWYSGLLFALGRTDESLQQAQIAVELDPLSAIVNAQLAGVLSGLGRFEESEARLRRVIEIDPSLPNAWSSLADLQAYAFNRYAEAIPLAQKAVTLDPANPYNPIQLCRMYLDLGEDAKAAEVRDAVRARAPDSAPALYYSLIWQLDRGGHEEALKDAQKLLALDPKDYFALFTLRNADLRAGHPEAARARYASTYPELLAPEAPPISGDNAGWALDLAVVLMRTGESDRAKVLLDRSEAYFRSLPRMGPAGYGILDAEIHALRGNRAEALAALRTAQQAGWRVDWSYYRDFEPGFDSIRDEPEFKAVFADIERDMAAQRAALAARGPPPP